jgi:hypothetical protein
MPPARYKPDPIQPGMKASARALVESGDNYWLYQRDKGDRNFAVVGAGADPGEFEKSTPAGAYRRIDMREFARVTGETARPAGSGRERPRKELIFATLNSVTHSGYFDEPTIVERMHHALHGSPLPGEKENEVL